MVFGTCFVDQLKSMGKLTFSEYLLRLGQRDRPKVGTLLLFCTATAFPKQSGVGHVLIGYFSNRCDQKLFVNVSEGPKLAVFRAGQCSFR